MATVPIPKINSFFREKKQSKLFLLLTIFYKIQVGWGFDYGFFNFKFTIAKALVKLSSLTICFSLTTVFFYYYSFKPSRYNIWLYAFLAKYILNVLFLIFLNAKSTLRSFHCDLKIIDSKVGFDNASFRLESKILLCGFLCFFNRIFVSISFRLVSDFYVRPLFIAVYFIGVLSNTDLLLISYAFIFYAVNCRLKNLTAIIKQAKCDFPSHLLTYKLYVDLVEKYKRTFDSLQVIALFSTIPEIMAGIFLSICELNWATLLSVNVLAIILEYTIVVGALAITLAPSIFAGMLTSQAEQIKLLLYDKLLEEKDNTNVGDDIERFIRYVEARPCRFRVWKVIPLNADLFKMVFNFCVTYLIVIIQFECETQT